MRSQTPMKGVGKFFETFEPSKPVIIPAMIKIVNEAIEYKRNRFLNAKAPNIICNIINGTVMNVKTMCNVSVNVELPAASTSR